MSILIDVEDPPEQTAASLVSGILGDLHHLVQQQFRLTRREVELEVRQCAAAGVLLGLGAAMWLVAGISLSLTLSHLLHWTLSPAGNDPASFPLWACHAAVAAGFAVVGGMMVSTGRARFRAGKTLNHPDQKSLQE